MGYFKIKKYNDNLYQLIDKLGVISTLVIGENKALVFDTCYGFANLLEEVKTITDKELIVVSSHGHMDHTAGNFHFDKVYINKLDYDLCVRHNSLAMRKANIARAKEIGAIDESFDVNNYLAQNEGNLEFINPGDVFDLGGLHAKVINMEGHTPGSIGILLEEWRLLLVADATCPYVWMFLDESLPLSKYIEMLERVIKLDFEEFLVGHDARLFKKEEMVGFLELAKRVDPKKSFKVNYEGFENNSYCYTEAIDKEHITSAVIFNPDKIK